MIRTIRRMTDNKVILDIIAKMKNDIENFLAPDKTNKLTKKQQEVDALFQPDASGSSRWVSREEIAGNKILDWGNNGAARHGIYFADRRYTWEKQGKGSITALRTLSYSDDVLYGAKRPIRLDIHAHHKKVGCVVCGSHSDLVTDHKNDLYNDPRVLDAKTQTIDDFQCLCNHCNLQKRQVSKVTKELGKRIGATAIPSLAIFGVDFVEGDETFDETDVNAMVGTYWYDPVAFMKQIMDDSLFVTIGKRAGDQIRFTNLINNSKVWGIIKRAYVGHNGLKLIDLCDGRAYIFDKINEIELQVVEQRWRSICK